MISEEAFQGCVKERQGEEQEGEGGMNTDHKAAHGCRVGRVGTKLEHIFGAATMERGNGGRRAEGARAGSRLPEGASAHITVLEAGSRAFRWEKGGKGWEGADGRGEIGNSQGGRRESSASQRRLPSWRQNARLRRPAAEGFFSFCLTAHRGDPGETGRPSMGAAGRSG